MTTTGGSGCVHSGRRSELGRESVELDVVMEQGELRKRGGLLEGDDLVVPLYLEYESVIDF